MFHRIPPSVQRTVGNVILFGLGLAVVAAAWGTWVRVQQSAAEGREQVRAAGQLMAEALDHELDVHVSHLNAMTYLAQRALSGKYPIDDNPIDRLAWTTRGDGFESNLPPDFGPRQHLGRFTGFGPLPKPDDPIKEEMQMVVGLTPLMRAIKERGNHVPWVHYASARGFMFIFPYEGSEDFFFSERLLSRDYFLLNRPEANPSREVIWSKPYADAAGQGLIVTVSQPIYQGDQFLGSLSIDFKVESLRRLLSGMPIPRTHVHVVHQSDRTRVVQAWDYQEDLESGHDIILLPLRSAPWSVELSVDEGALMRAAVQGRMWHFMATAILAMTFLILLVLVRSHRRIEALAITDGLTGLHNRRYFDEVSLHQFDLVRRKHLTLALALLDIDFFKKYNDHYGHQQGDAALKRIAEALRVCLRRGTDQVFRVGGEEFAVILALKSPQELPVMLAKINQAVRNLELEHVGNPRGRATVSVGAVLVEQDAWIPVQEAYKRADDALYKAKTSGRDRAEVWDGSPPVST